LWVAQVALHVILCKIVVQEVITYLDLELIVESPIAEATPL